MERTAEPGTLGVVLDALSVSVGSGGAVSVLVASVMSWIRQRSGRRQPASAA